MVVVQVVAAALNPVDFKQMRNPAPDAIVPKPRIVGFDVSGIVLSAGEGSGFSEGDAVYGMLPLVGSPWGSLAEVTVADARCFALAPKSVPLEQAAALPLVSLTVMQVFAQAGLLAGEDRSGQRILIHAAAGGVGSFAVQYARRVLGFGQVLATSSSRNAHLVSKLGATTVIDYKREAFEEIVADIGGVDAVLDPMAWSYMARTLDPANKVLRPAAKYLHILSTDWRVNAEETSLLTVLHGPFAKWSTRFKRLIDPHAPQIYSSPVRPDGERLARLARIVDDGLVMPAIDRYFDGLGSVAQALDYLQTGHARGKVVVRIKKP